MNRTLPFPDTRPLAAQSALSLPPEVERPGLLVGWSLEESHRKTPVGFSFGDALRSPETGFVDPILMEAEGHLMTIAPTGAGKGVGCIIPALLRHEGPAIVIDPKGENAMVTARHRREMGQEVIVLDPMGVTDLPGATLNPLDLIEPRSPTGVDDAAVVVQALLPDDLGDMRNRFWVSRARQLLLAAVLHVVTDLPEEKRSLATVRALMGSVAGAPQEVQRIFRKSRHPEVRAIAGNLSIAAAETLGGIISFAQDGIDFLRGPRLQDAVSATSFDLDKITRGDPVTLYLVLPPHMLSSHGRFLRLWISSLVTLVMRRRRRPRQSTLFILDEAAQLGTLNELRTAITLLRGYGLQTWSFWQDLSQLQLLYPHDWQTMINNCAVLQAFGPNTQQAAGEMARLLGFLSASEFLALEADEMLLQIAGDEAVIAMLPNYLRDPAFAGKFDENPLFDDDRDPVPEREIDRTYLRPARKVRKTKPEAAAGECGPKQRNPVDEVLSKMIRDKLDERLAEQAGRSAEAGRDTEEGPP
ncbi:type IV secretory system conjugative DNA transfer family protein [Acidimangrovimonas pyrenivorans]|uniref:Type IV secretory system conjugative DNA transfer family protein n=1 Tax=Acidimangrovimonas pyrenivorans TaxID=2030798 RepID=A0ABV7AF84_9RHOB